MNRSFGVRVLATAGALAFMASACATGPAPPAASPSSTTASAPSSSAASNTGSSGPDGSNPPATARNSTLGIGTDGSFPELGSSAYDVTNYDLDLEYDPDSNDLDATARIDGTANDELDELSFDFDGLDVSAVTVDGDKATFTVERRKLVIDAPDTIAKGASFIVDVDYGGRPTPRASDGVFGVEVGWHGGDGGSVVVSEPEGASTWFPANNHPRDKATFSFAIAVPEPYAAIANGRLERTDDHGDARTFHWVMDRPMASYLASVVTGEYDEKVHGEQDGVTFSDWAPAGGGFSPELTGIREVQLLSEKLGPFPFSTYGGVVYPAEVIQGSANTKRFLSAVALEVQGRSLYSEAAIEPRTVMHETAHQWMGDSVTLTDWSKDIWWVEGFARFAETAFSAPHRRHWEAIHANCEGETPGDLSKDELFGDGSYLCGSLVFYALQQRVGDETFWRILRTFNERFRYANATTDDLIATATDVSGQDLADFFDDWLFGPLPELP